MTEVFCATGIRKRYRRKSVLEDLDLRLAPGECTVLLGCNGAGKSTLLRMALGVVVPDAGEFTVLGDDPRRASPRIRRRIGYVPDTPDVPRWMTVRDLFRFHRAHYPTWNDDLAWSLVEQFAVPVTTRFGDLSRGEGMKAMMILAVATEPDLLLLDEPFAGLDPIVRDEVLRVVVGALRQGERTVLCATHELDVASRLADRVAILDGGRIRSHGSLRDVLGEDEPAAMPAALRRVLEREVVPC